MNPSVAELLVHSAKTTPDNIAVRFQGESTTYAALDAGSNKIAHGLMSKGIGRGDHVALYCINSPHFMMSYFGILKAGATVVPINLLLHPEEVQFLLNDSEAKALIYHQVTDKAVAAIRSGLKTVKNLIAIGETALEEADSFSRIMSEESDDAVLVVPEKEDALAAILYTGGTTGLPKGAMLMHTNLLANAASVAKALKLKGHQDKFLTVLPMFHSFGATVGFLTPISHGATVIAVPQFAPEATCKIIQEEKATVFMGVPTMYAMMANIPKESEYDLSSLRYGISGGAALPVSVLENFENRYNVPIYEGYGPTECSPVLTVNPIGGKRKIGSVGLPILGVELKIMDDEGKELPVDTVGEVCAKGANIMKGYFKREEETKESFHDEWFRTGDLGKMDDEHYFYIVDRSKDLIIVHGINVYPRQVEEVIYKHPAVAEAAVIGIPDDFHGELPKAFVALKEGYDLKPQDIIKHCRQHLGKFEIPRRVEFLDSLPKSGANKILKRKLREMEIGKKKEGK